MVRESANIFRLLDNVMSTKYGVTYLNDKSFKTWSCRDLAKFKNKISILIPLTFGLRIESKEMPTYASSKSKGWIFKRGSGGGGEVTWCNTQGTYYILMLTHIKTIDQIYLIQRKFSTKWAFKWWFLQKNGYKRAEKSSFNKRWILGF